MSKLYSYEAVEKLMSQYAEQGGEVAILDEGSLAYGLVIMYGEGLKTTIAKEVYINPWSSAQSIRMYNKTPQKYQKMIDDYENGVYDDDEEEIG